MEKQWNRRADENDLWWGRFKSYCRQGIDRSVSLAATGHRNAYPLPSHWMIVANKYDWRARSKAWDEAGGPKFADEGE